jgi:hypothetical protein
MARIKGSVTSEGMQAQVQQPLDDRQQVDYLSDLVDFEGWKNDEGFKTFYKGLLTVVTKDEEDTSDRTGLPDASKANNGLYIYTGAVGEAAVKDFANWKKVGSDGTSGGSTLTLDEDEDQNPSIFDNGEEFLTFKNTDEVKVAVATKKATISLDVIDEGFWK